MTKIGVYSKTMKNPKNDQKWPKHPPPLHGLGSVQKIGVAKKWTVIHIRIFPKKSIFSDSRPTPHPPPFCVFLTLLRLFWHFHHTPPFLTTFRHCDCILLVHLSHEFDPTTYLNYLDNVCECFIGDTVMHTRKSNVVVMKLLL
jgi:hypothetical protein